MMPQDDRNPSRSKFMSPKSITLASTVIVYGRNHYCIHACHLSNGNSSESVMGEPVECGIFMFNNQANDLGL
jgi:hypothetical protein